MHLHVSMCLGTKMSSEGRKREAREDQRAYHCHSVSTYKDTHAHFISLFSICTWCLLWIDMHQ